MKTTFKLASIAAAVFSLTLVSCDSKIETIPGSGEEGNETKVELSLSGKTTEVTKAGEELLTAGTVVGVFVVDNTSTETLPTAMIANVSHTATASGGLELTNLASSPISLNMGFRYDVYGYIPYQAGVTGSATTTLAVGHDVDFMWAKTTDEIPNTVVHTTELTFEHKTAQIAFKVVADPASMPDINGSTLKVTGFYGTGTIDLTTGVVTPGAVNNAISLTEVDKPTNFIAPVGGQKLALNAVVTVPQPNVGAGTYWGTLEIAFEEGTSYEYVITVTNNESLLGVAGYEVGWVDETGTIEVEQ